MITLSLVAIFASVIANTIKLSDDIQNSVRVVVYMRKDIQDQSEQIEKDGQTVTNENYHKVYDALTAMKHVDKVDFSSKEEQYDKLIKTAGNNWKIFDGDANPLYDAYYVETTAPKICKASFGLMLKKLKGSLRLKMVGRYPTFVCSWNLHPKLGLDWCSFIDLHRSLLDFKYHSDYHHFT